MTPAQAAAEYIRLCHVDDAAGTNLAMRFAMEFEAGCNSESDFAEFEQATWKAFA